MLARRRSGSRRRCSTPSTSSSSRSRGPVDAADCARRVPARHRPTRRPGPRPGAHCARAARRRPRRDDGRRCHAGARRSLADLRDRGAITPEEYEAQEGGAARPALGITQPPPVRSRRPRTHEAVRAPSQLRGHAARSCRLDPDRRSSCSSRSRSTSSATPAAAYRLGDGTAKLFGRLTLNPIVHFDPLGGAAAASSPCSPAGFVFGWAKPTPVNPANLRDRRNGEVIVALAGPALEPAHGHRRRVRGPAALMPRLGIDVPEIVAQVLLLLRALQRRCWRSST